MITEADLKPVADYVLFKLSDKELHAAVIVAAELLSKLKKESVKRGLWEKFKGEKVMV